MKVHQLKDPIYTSNVYLIDAQRPVLVDTGLSITDDVLALVADALGGRALSAIVFTHGHPDHIGDADLLSEKLHAPLYIHRHDHDKLPSAEVLGDSVDVGNAVFRVLHTPGHSPGGVSLYDPKHRVLFSGDCVFPGGRAGRWDLEGADYDQLLASVQTLAALEVSVLYPGHYDPISSDVARHLRASVETVEIVGNPFDEAAYDARIQALGQPL